MRYNLNKWHWVGPADIPLVRFPFVLSLCSFLLGKAFPVYDAISINLFILGAV